MNEELKAEVSNLKMKINDLEQRDRLFNVKINGIPVNRDENPKQIILGIANQTQARITKNDIDICHRLPVSRRTQTPGLIVKFKYQECPEKTNSFVQVN